MPATPTITTISNPVGITTANPNALSYQQLLATLNWITYEAKEIYIKANSIQQVSQLFTINTVAPTGEVKINNLIPLVDPEQFQSVIDMSLQKATLIIDDLTTLRFTLLPGETVQIDIWADTVSFNYLLNKAPEIEKPAEVYKQRKKTVYLNPWAVVFLFIAATSMLIYAGSGKNKG
jgi:SepF-like predicted cell division protein (DUF552 family)